MRSRASKVALLVAQHGKDQGFVKRVWRKSAAMFSASGDGLDVQPGLCGREFGDQQPRLPTLTGGYLPDRVRAGLWPACRQPWRYVFGNQDTPARKPSLPARGPLHIESSSPESPARPPVSMSLTRYNSMRIREHSMSPRFRCRGIAVLAGTGDSGSHEVTRSCDSGESRHSLKLAGVSQMSKARTEPKETN